MPKRHHIRHIVIFNDRFEYLLATIIIPACCQGVARAGAASVIEQYIRSWCLSTSKLFFKCRCVGSVPRLFDHLALYSYEYLACI